MRNPVLLRALVTGTVADLKRAVDYLETQRVCRHNIAYAGISLGAMIGSVLTAQDKRIRAVILMSVPPSWRALISSAPTIILPGIEQHPEQLKQAVDLLSPLNPDRWIGQISPRPLLLMIGRQDPIVPAAAARQIEGAARTPKTVVNYQGSHNPLGPTDASPNAQDIANFLLRHIVEPSYPGS